jgi:hypothetical protein
MKKTQMLEPGIIDMNKRLIKIGTFTFFITLISGFVAHRAGYLKLADITFPVSTKPRQITVPWPAQDSLQKNTMLPSSKTLILVEPLPVYDATEHVLVVPETDVLQALRDTIVTDTSRLRK